MEYGKFRKENNNVKKGNMQQIELALFVINQEKVNPYYKSKLFGAKKEKKV